MFVEFSFGEIVANVALDVPKLTKEVAHSENCHH
jgi:hypothetical protein